MPSLYETTAAVGDVESSNFTTLYNASGLTVPNAGAGTVSGNLNVGGNLTVQGTSLLQGAVTLGSTLCLPNYCFPLPDGSQYQVLATDGSGNLYWSNITAIPGADYNISATTATGGANLTLSNTSGSVVDNVKFAGGTNITVTRTDANTITISTSADDIPNGTARGQVLYWDGSAWTASSQIRASTSGARLQAIYENSTAGPNSAIFLRKDYGATNYSEANNDGVAINYGLISNSQGTTQMATQNVEYSTTGDHQWYVTTSANNFATAGNVVISATKAEAGIYAPNFVLNRAQSGSPTLNAQIIANRGSSTDATITWDETDDRWELNNDLLATGLQGGNVQIAMGAGSDNQIYIGGNDLLIDTDGSHVIQSNSPIQTTAESMSINSDDTANSSYLYMKGTSRYLQWDNTNGRFELTDTLYISDTDIPAIMERQTTAAVTSSNEIRSGISLIERVTDAGSNATDNGGVGVKLSRTSGASGGAQVDWGLIGGRYYGTTNTADLTFNWSDDNFAETSPGVFPGTYQLLRLGATDAEFFNDSLYIDYTTLGAAQVGINTTTPAYTLDVNGDANVTGDITVSGVKVDLATPVQQGQLLYVSDAVTPTITNSSVIKWLSTTYRPTFEANTGVYGRTQSGATVRNNTLANNYTTGDGTSLLYGVDSNAQSSVNFGSTSATYDAGGNHIMTLGTSTNNFNNDQVTSITGGNTLNFSAAHGFSIGDRLIYISASSNGLVFRTTYYVIAAGFTTTACQVSLTLGGSAVVLTNGTGLSLWFTDGTNRNLSASTTEVEIEGTNFTFNAFDTGVPGVDATITVERGTSGGDAQLKWNETADRWQFTNDGTTFYNIPINIDDLADVVITPPTAAGQFLFNNGTNWINDNKVTSTASADRAVFEYKPSTSPSGVSSTLYARKNTGSTTFTTGDGAGMGFQLDSDSQATTGIGFLGVVQDTAPYFTLNTSTDSFVSNNVQVAKIDSAAVNFNGTSLTLNANGTAAAAVDAYIYVERGTTGSDASIKWEEANDFWRMSNDLYVDGTAIGGTALATNGNYLYFNNDDVSAADTYIVVKRNPDPDVNIRWNETTDRWQTTTDGSTYLDIPNQNLDTTSDVDFASVEIDNLSTYNTQTTTTTSTALTTISSTTRKSQKVVINIIDNVTGEVHILEALALRKGVSAAYLTTYAEMYSNTALATFTADAVTISGSDYIRIRATPASTNSTTFTVARISLD